MPVPTLRAETSTPGSTAPEGSCTLPPNEALLVCPNINAGANRQIAVTSKTRLMVSSVRFERSLVEISRKNVDQRLFFVKVHALRIAAFPYHFDLLRQQTAEHGKTPVAAGKMFFEVETDRALARLSLKVGGI